MQEVGKCLLVKVRTDKSMQKLFLNFYNYAENNFKLNREATCSPSVGKKGILLFCLTLLLVNSCY